MPIVYCPSCSKKIRAPEAGIGKRGQCPKCKAWMVIPNQDQEPPAQLQNDEPPALPDSPPALPDGPPPLPVEPSALADDPPRIPGGPGTIAVGPRPLPRATAAALLPARTSTPTSRKKLLAVAGVLTLALIVGGVLYFTAKTPKPAEEVPLSASTLAPPSADLTQEEYRAVRRKELDEMRTTDPERYKREVAFLQQHDHEEWQAITLRDSEPERRAQYDAMVAEMMKKELDRKMRRDARDAAMKYRKELEGDKPPPPSPFGSGRQSSPTTQPSTPPPTQDTASTPNPAAPHNGGYYTGNSPDGSIKATQLPPSPVKSQPAPATGAKSSPNAIPDSPSQPGEKQQNAADPKAKPSGGPKAKSALNMANQYVKIAARDKAIEYANKVIEQYPNTSEADEAAGILEALK